MKKLAFTLASIFALSGCVTAGPVNGAIFSDVQGPVAATSNPRGNLHGEACATSWFGLIAQGDASISTAARNGRIATISYVEQHTKGVVFYTKYCTEVWGYTGASHVATPGPAPVSAAPAARPAAPAAAAQPATL